MKDLLRDIYGPGDDDYGRNKSELNKRRIIRGRPEEMDNCVSCGKETDCPKTMPIDYRYYYVEGAGQLCKECYDKIYNK